MPRSKKAHGGLPSLRGARAKRSSGGGGGGTSAGGSWREWKVYLNEDVVLLYTIKVVLPPPVHFWKYADVWPYKTYGGKPHTICMGETESRPIRPYLPYKINADHPRGRREEYGPEARPVRHRRPHDMCGGACRVGWSSMAAEVGKSHMYSSPAAPPCIQYERG